jgi:hypothetical protein
MKRLLLSFGLIAACHFAACSLDTRPHQANTSGSGSSDCQSTQTCDAGAIGTAGHSGAAASSGTTAGSGASAGMGGISGGAALPPPKHPDGETCQADTDCLNSHCDHQICCVFGNCCHAVTDCPPSAPNSVTLTCSNPPLCKGTRGGDVVCKDFSCTAQGGSPDDTACTSATIAKQCDYYLPIKCNGASNQAEPQCPSSCVSNSDCDDNGHCDAVGHCVADTVNGVSCLKDADCTSGHCSGIGQSTGFCCDSGDCCAADTDCNDSYATKPVCDDATSCQGSRHDKKCVNSQCMSMQADDDSGCSALLANTCGDYADALCTDSQTQPTAGPACRTSCMVDAECDRTAYCQRPVGNAPGSCQPKLADGATCTVASSCENNVCTNDHCCSDTNPGTLCCNVDSDCPAPTSMCANTTACGGFVHSYTCNSMKICLAKTTADNNACTQMISCPVGFSVRSAICPATCSCQADRDCDVGFICQGMPRGACVPEPSAGTGGNAAAGAGGVGSGAAGRGSSGAGGS